MPAVSLGTRKTAFKELPFLHLSYQSSALLTLLRISEGCLRFENSAAPTRTDPERPGATQSKTVTYNSPPTSPPSTFRLLSYQLSSCSCSSSFV